MELIDKTALVAEIERLREEKGTFYASDVLYNLEDFINTLEVKEVQEETVSNDLEEAVKKYLTSLRKSHFEGYDIERAFKKGAQWQKEQKYVWSEEDERTIHNIDAAIRHEVVFPINELKSMEIWLESLKYRIRPKHEWKRDEKMFQLIEDVIDVYRKTQGSVVGGIYTEELKDFLNCIASKQDWKPSNEQIEILDMVLTNESMDDNIARILRELREQLKKLREE